MSHTCRKDGGLTGNNVFFAKDEYDAKISK